MSKKKITTKDHEGEPTTHDTTRPADSEKEVELRAIIAETKDISPKAKAAIEKARAEQDTLNQRTGGQYKALMELRKAIVNVAEIDDCEQTFENSDEKAGKEWCEEQQLVFFRMADKVRKAMANLRGTGFAVPKKWIVAGQCAGVYATTKCVLPATPEIPGKWRVIVSGADDKVALRNIWAEIGAEIEQLANAEHAAAQDGKGKQAADAPGQDGGGGTAKRANEMTDAVVLAKADAAAVWCKHASVHTAETDGKPWEYLLIPHDQISEQMSLAGLAARCTYKLRPQK